MIKIKKPDIHFGIRIVTYPRNGLTKSILPKTLQAVLNQTYTNWTIYLTGDDYLPKEDFDYFESLIPKEKIKIKNINISPERYSYRGNDLWKCGGINAINYTMDWMQDEGIKYFVTLDDDDCWRSNHLEVLNNIYSEFPEAYFVYTSGINDGNGLINPTKRVSDIFYNNLMPMEKIDIIHSLTSWRLDKIPLRYVNPIGLNHLGGDEFMWQRMKNFLIKNNYKSIFVPEITLNYLRNTFPL